MMGSMTVEQSFDLVANSDSGHPMGSPHGNLINADLFLETCFESIPNMKSRTIQQKCVLHEN
ncbi:unnamed protein product [Musa acuminata var. zebrina]